MMKEYQTQQIQSLLLSILTAPCLNDIYPTLSFFFRKKKKKEQVSKIPYGNTQGFLPVVNAVLKHKKSTGE